MNVFVWVLILLAPLPATAGDMYKCTINGITAYQYSPCQGSAQQAVIKEKKLNKIDMDAGEEFEKGISLSPLYVKTDEVDSIGYQWLFYKATIINNTDTEKKLYITYKGIDANGFEVDSIGLDGTVPAHSSKELTNKHPMKPEEFARIEKWVLDK